MKLGCFSTSNAQTKVALKLLDLLTLRCRLFDAQRFFFCCLNELMTKLHGVARIVF